MTGCKKKIISEGYNCLKQMETEPTDTMENNFQFAVICLGT
jgi:hypothetical protein